MNKKTKPAPWDCRHAVLSPDGLYRYSLSRSYYVDRAADVRPEGTTLVVVGLNPSTADAKKDDPTIRKCVGFARRLDCTGLLMLNLFAYRATHPTELHAQARAWGSLRVIGPDNDATIATILDAMRGTPKRIVAAWGAHAARYPLRTNAVTYTLAQYGTVYRFGALTKHGQPAHPLMLPYATKLEVHEGADHFP